MNQIFVSYASEDRSRVQPLVAALQSSGWSVFWDRTIPAGRSWRDFIGKALVEAQAVVVVWTEKSVTAEWVLEEAEAGKRRRCLIPVLLDAVEPPLGFGSIQAAHLVGWAGDPTAAAYRSLAADIAAVIGSARGDRAPSALPPSARQATPSRATGTASPAVAPGRRWQGAAAIVAGVLVLGIGIAWTVPWLRSPAASVPQPLAQTSVASVKPAPAKQESTQPEPAKPQLTRPLLTAVPAAAAAASPAAATESALSRALKAMAVGCDNLVFDADSGTLNGLSPAASQEMVKQRLPCSTGDTPDGSNYNYGGGVFFTRHDFYFYTGRDFIELRQSFAGRETRPLLGLNKLAVTLQLGSKHTEIGSLAWLFEKSYGCLRLDFGYPEPGAERVTQIGAYLQPCSRNQALRS